MKKFKHIITCILAIVISICLLTTSVSAAWINEAGHWYVNCKFARLAVGGVLAYAGGLIGAGAGTIVLPGGGTIEGSLVGKAVGGAIAAGIYNIAEYYAQGYTDDDFYEEETSIVAGMSRSDVLASHSVTGFSASSLSTSYYRSGKLLAPSLFANNSNKTISLLDNTFSSGSALIVGIRNDYLLGYMVIDGMIARVQFVNPFDFANVSYLGVYSSESLEIHSGSFLKFNGGPVFLSDDVARVYFGDSWATSKYSVVNISDLASIVAGSSQESWTFNKILHKDPSSLDFWTYNNPTSAYWDQYDKQFDGLSFSGDTQVIAFMHATPNSISWDNSRIVVAAPEAKPETRPSSLMQAIHNYNVDNSYTDNSTTVNYFLAPKDQTPTSDNVVSPAIFDEETWVFTEPATGAQYQSTGWTYDYNTRTYDIDLEAGTFTLDGTDVTRIVSQYGNELATITYYDASGNALATDEYNYVMMAASECALNGHTYNANTTKEPTCTAAGERTYTCSVCGDQYVEEIAKTDHVYADHTITQEPTCTVGGILSKTCSTCGDQIIEKLDPLGHDFIAKEITETKYDLPPGTSCPSCSGTTYTFSRQGIIYTLLCSDCNTEWTAEADVTYGSTTYVCSRCGESKVEGDATEETQETWFTKFIYKFKWLSSIGQIYRQLVADITSDAETAAAIADGTVTLDEVTSGHAELGGGSAGSEGSGRQYTAPELAISFGDSDLYGVDWDAIKPLNLSWYAPHKEIVDGIVSGILWLGFLFLLIKRAPGIIQGAEMITEDRIKIDFYNRR